MKTIAQLIGEVRDDLDEPLDPGSNFWSDDYIIGRLNRGLRQVYQTMREEKGSSWFVRELRSTDAPLTIFGQTYDPASLRITSGLTEMVLPPDFGEMCYFEPLPDAIGVDSAIVFHWTELGSDRFRSLSRFDNQNEGITTTGGSFWCSVVQRPTGPVIVFAPVVRVGQNTNTRLEYVLKPKNYAAGDTLENSGFDDLMLDAVIAYAELECYRKEGDGQRIGEAAGRWQEKMNLCKRAAGPHQTIEAERVRGYMEEETI